VQASTASRQGQSGGNVVISLPFISNCLAFHTHLTLSEHLEANEVSNNFRPLFTHRKLYEALARKNQALQKSPVSNLYIMKEGGNERHNL
jgi:hypothetical protein